MTTNKTPHLLSVEDNPETRTLLKHLLGGEYEVTFAQDAQEALNLIGSDESFDLFLLDINLQSEDGGTELLHDIRDREGLDDVPAIALTAFAMPGDRREFLNKGFDEYVSKPFTKTELTDRIDETLSST